MRLLPRFAAAHARASIGLAAAFPVEISGLGQQTLTAIACSAASTATGTRITAEQWVPLPLSDVFSFFSDPRNLTKLMPPAQEVRIAALRLQALPAAPNAAPIAGIGSEIDVLLRPIAPLPVRVRWTARMVEFVQDKSFTDEQVRGPFRRWRHRHEFEAEVRDEQMGTLVRDVVEFKLGWGRLGRLAMFVVTHQVKRTFRYRQRALLPALLKNQEKR